MDMLWMGEKEAVVFMRLSSGDGCELRGGAAFVNPQTPNNSVRQRMLESFIFARCS